MFEKAVVRTSETGVLLTLGSIAEALLYYQSVHLILDYSSLSFLLSQIKPAELLALLSRKGVTATYFRSTLGTATKIAAGIEHHGFVGFNVTAKATGENVASMETLLRSLAIERGSNKGESYTFASGFLKRVKISDLVSHKLVPGGIPEAAMKDVFDPAFMDRALYELLKMTPGAEDPSGIHVDVLRTELGFHVVGNIDFTSINRRRHQLSENPEDLTMAQLLTKILSARADLSLAAHYGGDFKTSAASSALIRLKAAELIQRASHDEKTILQFQEIVLEDARSLREVIDAGERKFSELMTLLDKSQLFKHWTGAQNPDATLVTEYFKEANDEGWISSLPVKGVRYFLGLALAAKVPVVAEMFAAADAFLLDKLLRGWSPSHFVDKTLKPFVVKK